MRAFVSGECDNIDEARVEPSLGFESALTIGSRCHVLRYLARGEKPIRIDMPCLAMDRCGSLSFV